MKIEEGVMVVKDGKGWGIIYEDGRSTEYGWMAVESAPIHDPEYCKKPTDVTYQGSYLIPRLQEGKLVKVVRKTTVEFIE
jgi:hypothetical protein